MGVTISSIINKIARIDFDLLNDCYWSYPLVPVEKSPDILSKQEINNHKYSMQQKGGDEEIYIYIHIPFCLSFCTFCPYRKYIFNKSKITDYLSALKNEIDLYGKKEYSNRRRVPALYFGGGTPNLLTAKEIIELLNYCREYFYLNNDIEITLEVAPFALSIKKLTDLLKGGINRLSLGVQTFNDKLRKSCKVRASGKEVCDIVNSAHDVGYKNINIDLIYNFPGQTLEDFHRDLKTAIKLKPESISCYVLAVCLEAELYNMWKRGIVKLNKNSLAIKMYALKEKVLQDAGYKRYHLTSDYALKENNFCKYYFGRIKDSAEFVGFGAGANSLLNGYAHKNTVSLKKYYEKVSNCIFPISYGLKIDNDMRIRRAAISELGTGFLRRDSFLKKFGIDPLDYFSNAIRELEYQKLITINKNNIRVSYIGQFYWTYVCAYLFSREVLEKIYNVVKNKIGIFQPN